MDRCTEEWRHSLFQREHYAGTCARQVIREIGNYFAHHLEATTFDKSPVVDRCEGFWAARVKPVGQFGPKGRPGRARDLYNISIGTVAHELDYTHSRLRQCHIAEGSSPYYRGEAAVRALWH